MLWYTIFLLRRILWDSNKLQKCNSSRMVAYVTSSRILYIILILWCIPLLYIILIYSDFTGTQCKYIFDLTYILFNILYIGRFVWTKYYIFWLAVRICSGRYTTHWFGESPFIFFMQFSEWTFIHNSQPFDIWYGVSATRM